MKDVGKTSFVAMLGNRLVEVLVMPIWKKLELDTFWLMPIAWVTCGVLSWLAGLNVFADVFPNLNQQQEPQYEML